MLSREQLAAILSRYGIEFFGVMSFGDINNSDFIPCRAASRLPDNAKTVLVCGFPYLTDQIDMLDDTRPRNVCRYAVFPDYHKIIIMALEAVIAELRELYPEAGFAAFCDISPLPEVFCAVRAGLGFRGENNLLITKEYGSYLLLGEIVTDLTAEYAAPCEKSCLSCGECARNCPNGAISVDGFDKMRCVSYISQKKGELTQDEAEALAKIGLAWGCDRCQEVCPHNTAAYADRRKAKPFAPLTASIQPTLTYENMAELIKTHSYGYKGEAVLKRNLDIIGRNKQ